MRNRWRTETGTCTYQSSISASEKHNIDLSHIKFIRLVVVQINKDSLNTSTRTTQSQIGRERSSKSTTTSRQHKVKNVTNIHSNIELIYMNICTTQADGT